MNHDHEVSFMFAPQPWGTFQPRTNLYSPFSNAVLRVVQPARPALEDIMYQLFASEEIPIRRTDTQPEPPLLEDSPNSPTAYDELSERMAREMQEQEDREQAIRDRAGALQTQLEEFMSSMFGGSHSSDPSLTPMFRQRQDNAEAGPSTVKKPAFKPASGFNLNSSNLHNPRGASDEDESISGESDKKAGKKRAHPAELDPACNTPSALLDNFEAALRHETNQFDFPEQLEFQAGSASAGTPPSPVLLHTPSNSSVHAFEKALADIRLNLSLIQDNGDISVSERRSQLDGRIHRELEDLDRRILEAWAAKRRYFPNLSSGSV